MAVITSILQAVILFTLSAFIRAGLTTQNSFDGLLEDVTSCRDSCDQTFPLHTYPKPSHLQACRRGCRFFAMMDFVEETDTADFNETSELCKSTCMDAYRASGELDACILGCDNQVPFAIQEHSKWAKEEPNIHILMPFMSLQSSFQQMMNQAQGFSLKSWSVFMWGDNGQIYVYETKPELDIFTVDPEAQQSALRGLAKTARTYETNLEVQNQYGHMEANRGGYPTDNESYGWLDCVSKKSGLPRWLLSVTIFLSALAMIWLCCATTATAPDQRLTVQKLSINGDLEYLNECKKYPHPIYIKTVPAHTISAINQDEDDDVEPLPLHVDIVPPQTKI